MAASSDVILNVITKTEAALKKISDFSKQSTQLLGNVDKKLSFLNQSFSSFAGNLGAGIALKGVEAASAALSGLADVIINDSVAAAEGYQNSLNGLVTSLELTGKASEESVKFMEDFAATIQSTTKFSDDAVLSTAAYIQQLGSLDKDGLKRATQAAIDLSAALGKDLGTTTELVAKAATGNIQAFGRLGLEMKKGKTDAETFANALAEIEKRFGGASLKTVNTYSGAIAQAKNGFDDFLKVFGNLVVKSPGVIGAIKGVTQVISNISNLLGKEVAGQDPFKTLILSALDFSEALVNYVVRPVIFLKDVFDGVFNAIRTGIQIAIVVPLAAIAETVGALGSVVGVFSDDTSKALSDFREVAVNTAADFANKTNESFNDIKNQEFASSITEQIGVIRSSVQNQLEAVPAIANKAASDTARALEPLSDKVIEIGVKVGDPTAIAASLAQAQAVVDEAEAKNQLSAAARNEARILAEVETQQKIVDAQIQAQMQLATFNQEDNLSKLELEKQVIAERLKMVKEETDAYAQLKKREAFVDRQIAAQRLGYAQAFFGDMASLMKTGNKDLFAIGKAAALAEATVSGALAIQKALAAAPPPINFALAAAVGVRTAVQIAQISAQTLAKGTDFVTGGVAGKDSVPALLMPGERVISTPQNKDLSQFLEAEKRNQKDDDSIGILNAILERLGQLENTTIVNVGNREIIREVREGLRSGRQLVAT